MVDNANFIFRDYNIDKVPSSGKLKPRKRLIRPWGTALENAVNAFLTNGGLIYATKADMDVDLAHGVHTAAWVIADPTVANNAIYRKLLGSGVGSWTYAAPLPYEVIVGTDSGAGTANAIQVITELPVPDSSGRALIVFNISETNAGSPVTVSFNGGTTLTIITSSGNQIVAGGLVADTLAVGFKHGDNFRLLSDMASAAIVAAAEAAAEAAIDAMSAVMSQIFPTKAALLAYDPDVDPTFVALGGNLAAGDMGELPIILKKEASAPAHEGYALNANGAVYEIAGNKIPGWFFTKTAHSGDDALGLKDAIECAIVKGGGEVYYTRKAAGMAINSPVRYGQDDANEITGRLNIKLKLGGNAISLGSPLYYGNLYQKRYWLEIEGGQSVDLTSECTELYGNMMIVDTGHTTFKKGMRGFIWNTAGIDGQFWDGRHSHEFTIDYYDPDTGVLAFDPQISISIPVADAGTGELSRTTIGMEVYDDDLHMEVDGEGGSYTGILRGLGETGISPNETQDPGSASQYGISFRRGVFEVHHFDMYYGRDNLRCQEAMLFYHHSINKGAFNGYGVKGDSGSHMYVHNVEMTQSRHFGVGSGSSAVNQSTALIVNCRIGGQRQSENELVFPGSEQGSLDLHPNAKSAEVHNCWINGGFQISNGRLVFIGGQIRTQQVKGIGTITGLGTDNGSVEFYGTKWMLARYIAAYEISSDPMNDFYGEGTFVTEPYLFRDFTPTYDFTEAGVDVSANSITINRAISRGKKVRVSTTGTLPAPLAHGTDYFAYERNHYVAVASTASFTTFPQSASSAAGGTATLVAKGAGNTLIFQDLAGTWSDGGLITGGTDGSSAQSGTLLTAGKLYFDGQTVDFTNGQTVTGTNGVNQDATALVLAQSDSGATGHLWIGVVTELWFDNMTMSDPLGGNGVANIPNGIYEMKVATTYANALSNTAINITDDGTGTHTVKILGGEHWKFIAKNVEIVVEAPETWGASSEIECSPGGNLFDDVDADIRGDFRNCNIRALLFNPHGSGAGTMNVKLDIRGAGVRINTDVNSDDWKDINVEGRIDNTDATASYSTALEVAGDATGYCTLENIRFRNIYIETIGTSVGMRGGYAMRGISGHNCHVNFVASSGTLGTGIQFLRNPVVGPTAPETSLDFLFIANGCSVRWRPGRNAVTSSAVFANAGEIGGVGDAYKARVMALSGTNYWGPSGTLTATGGIVVS